MTIAPCAISAVEGDVWQVRDNAIEIEELETIYKIYR
jgi:hypothetical protein